MENWFKHCFGWNVSNNSGNNHFIQAQRVEAVKKERICIVLLEYLLLLPWSARITQQETVYHLSYYRMAVLQPLINCIGQLNCTFYWSYLLSPHICSLKSLYHLVTFWNGCFNSFPSNFSKFFIFHNLNFPFAFCFFVLIITYKSLQAAVNSSNYQCLFVNG